MGLFKNEIGRPSNDTLRKRRLAYFIFTLLVVFVVGGGIYGIKKIFFKTDVFGSSRNASTDNYNKCTGFDSKVLTNKDIYVVPNSNIKETYKVGSKEIIKTGTNVKKVEMIPEYYSTTQGMAVTNNYIVYSIFSHSEKIPTQIRFLNRKTGVVDDIVEYSSFYHASDMTYDQANNEILVGYAREKSDGSLDRRIAFIKLDSNERPKKVNGKYQVEEKKIVGGVTSKIAYDRDLKRVLLAGSGAKKKMFVLNRDGSATQIKSKTSEMCFPTSQAMDYYKNSIYYLTWQGSDDDHYNKIDNAINIFDLKTSKLKRVLIIRKETLAGEMEAVEFSPKGEMFVSIGLNVGSSKRWQYVGFYEIKPIVLSTTSESLLIGQKKRIKASVVPIASEDASVSWTSSNTSIATVSSNGVVTAIKPGIVTITAKNSSGKASAKVTIESNMLGDVATAPNYTKRDQRLTTCDEYVVTRIVNGQKTSSTIDSKYADINGDGKINSTDAKLVSKLVTKIGGYYIGDVNKDNKINEKDAELILKYSTGALKPDVTQKELADINGDGKINSIDAKIASQIGNKYGDFCSASSYSVGDGKITSADYQGVIYYLEGKIKFTEKQKKAADVNFDGKITNADAELIKQMNK